MARQRLDMLLVARGTVETREKAKALIMAGEVAIDGQLVDRPAALVPADANIVVRNAPRYASRGGLKLEHALVEFGLDVAGQVVIDVGASTGGFTDCLLQHGAGRVFAVDVGYGQLAWRLRTDPKVVVYDRTNIRHLPQLPEQADGAVIDVSFISLRLVLPKVAELTKPGAWMIALIKPQFEAGRGKVGKGGVVRDRAVHRAVLEDTLGWAYAHDLAICGVTPSPILGPAGNREFLAYLRKTDESIASDCQEADWRTLTEAAVSAEVEK